ncbi:TetR/AcrR family transcriptional regulator [Pelagicoccus sp. SDUM812003]|uniref:TetR/AcrR family transcriptional regulator n=1 Tax=Pelagicoccus sp. SDUM812003 TaxID=3041267 RepID=UPI00280CCD3B|nr:TetR/AcrR family transcriptional regulator [Pelagicoccus sp. SDUM812003]MDQ8201502.1 TetR/AcrR family transcriptional regulator [Pelagicoccus sp. SDUM812003]
MKTKERILDIALRHTQKAGFRGFSFRDLAAEIGVKSAAIHYHFPTKADLGRELAARYYESDMAYLRAADDLPPEKRLDHFLELFSKTLDDGLFCLFASAASDRDVVPAEMNEYATRFFGEASKWLEKAFQEADPEGKNWTPGLGDRCVALVYGAFLMAHNNADPELFRKLTQSYRTSNLPV